MPDNRQPRIFTVDEREQMRSQLLERAAFDPRISGAAITGSAAANCEDRWSDIDLAFGIVPRVNVNDVIADWTAHMYDKFSVLHHLDVPSGRWTYRVFLLPNALQIDIAFVTDSEFRALTPNFRLVHGSARDPQHVKPPSAEHLIGMAWLYALHARSAIARERFWQAEFMISGMRDYSMALACLLHQLPTSYGKGFDQLPHAVLEEYKAALVRSLELEELCRAFGMSVSLLVKEIRYADPELAGRLENTLLMLAKF